MTTWTSDEIKKIGRAEELEIASLRRDGTLRDPVTIWVVRHGDDIYVRSVNGRTAAWFRGTQMREGHIEAGAASIISSIVSPEARSTTIKLVPRSARRATGALGEL